MNSDFSLLFIENHNNTRYSIKNYCNDNIFIFNTSSGKIPSKMVKIGKIINYI